MCVCVWERALVSFVNLYRFLFFHLSFLMNFNSICWCKVEYYWVCKLPCESLQSPHKTKFVLNYCDCWIITKYSFLLFCRKNKTDWAVGYVYLNYLMCLVKWSFHNIKAKTKQKGTYHATDNKHFTCALEKRGVLIRTLFNKQFALPCR